MNIDSNSVDNTDLNNLTDDKNQGGIKRALSTNSSIDKICKKPALSLYDITDSDENEAITNEYDETADRLSISSEYYMEDYEFPVVNDDERHVLLRQSIKPRKNFINSFSMDSVNALIKKKLKSFDLNRINVNEKNLTLNLDRLQNEIEISHNQTSTKLLLNEYKKLKESFNDIKMQLENKIQECNDSTAENMQYKENVEALKRKLAKKEAEVKELVEYDDEKDLHNSNEISALQEKIVELENHSKGLRSMNTMLEDELNKLKEENHEQNKKISEYVSRIKQIIDEKREIEQKYNESDVIIANYKNINDDLNEKINYFKAKLDQLKGDSDDSCLDGTLCLYNNNELIEMVEMNIKNKDKIILTLNSEVAEQKHYIQSLKDTIQRQAADISLTLCQNINVDSQKPAINENEKSKQASDKNKTKRVLLGLCKYPNCDGSSNIDADKLYHTSIHSCPKNPENEEKMKKIKAKQTTAKEATPIEIQLTPKQINELIIVKDNLEKRIMEIRNTTEYELQNLQAIIEDKSKIIEKLKQDLQDKEENIVNLHEQICGLKNTLLETQEEHEATKKSLIDEIREIEEKQMKIEEEKSDLIDEMETLKTEKYNLSSTINKLKIDIEEAKVIHSGNAHEKSNELNMIKNEYAIIQKQLEKTKKECNDIETLKNDLQSKRKYCQNLLYEINKYKKISLELEQRELNLIGENDKLNKEIDTLKKQIDSHVCTSSEINESNAVEKPSEKKSIVGLRKSNEENKKKDKIKLIEKPDHPTGHVDGVKDTKCPECNLLCNGWWGVSSHWAKAHKDKIMPKEKVICKCGKVCDGLAGFEMHCRFSH